MLSDLQRRREYDTLYESRSDRTTDPNIFAGFFTNVFGGTNANATQPDPDHVFTDVFDEVRSNNCLDLTSPPKFLCPSATKARS